jgi:drug/metabolite transporter (DMT)-like permease
MTDAATAPAADPPLRAWLPTYALLGVLWGAAFMFVSFGLESFTAVGVSWGKHTLAFVLLLPIMLARRTPMPPRAMWRHMIVASLLFSVVPGTLFAFAQTHVSSSLAAILNAATPLVTLLVIVVAFPEERMTKTRIAGLFIGFVGVLVVVGVWKGLIQGERIALIAIAVAVLGPSIAFPYVRRHLARTIDPITFATTQVGVGAVVLLPLVFVTGVTSGPVTRKAVLGMLALGFLSTGTAYALNFAVIKKAGPSTASTIAYVIPVVAVAFGVLLLNEPLSWNEPVGGLIVLIGAAISQGRFGRGTTKNAAEPGSEAEAEISSAPL